MATIFDGLYHYIIFSQFKMNAFNALSGVQLNNCAGHVSMIMKFNDTQDKMVDNRSCQSLS